MYTLVTLQVVLLDETHITYVTLKWLLTWPNQREGSIRRYRRQGPHSRYLPKNLYLLVMC